jgi:hypothetical protein
LIGKSQGKANGELSATTGMAMILAKPKPLRAYRLA